MQVTPDVQAEKIIELCRQGRRQVKFNTRIGIERRHGEGFAMRSCVLNHALRLKQRVVNDIANLLTCNCNAFDPWVWRKQECLYPDHALRRAAILVYVLGVRRHDLNTAFHRRLNALHEVYDLLFVQRID